MDGDDDLPDLPRSRGDNSGSPPSGNRSLTSSRASTPGPRLPPLPQSLRQARAILKEKAHINLADYLAARAAVGTVDYAEMLHPSSAAMIRYTKKNGKFVQLGMVKTEWLEPLLRDFGFKRSRIAAAADPRR